MASDDEDDGRRRGRPQRGGGSDPTQQLSAVRRQFAETLIRSIDEDEFPSFTQMDIAERCMTPEQRVRYIRALVDKIERETYPSVPMMQRVMRLVGQ